MNNFLTFSYFITQLKVTFVCNLLALLLAIFSRSLSLPYSIIVDVEIVSVTFPYHAHTHTHIITLVHINNDNRDSNVISLASLMPINTVQFGREILVFVKIHQQS
jgi:hypothetical protein